MLTRLSRTAVAAAFATVALSGAAFSPASASEVVCPTAEELQVSMDDATAAAQAAKQAFKDSQRPLGQQVKTWRQELREEVKALQSELRELRKAYRDAETDEERTAVKDAYDAARALLREDRHLLQQKRALLAEIKAGRAEARAAWKDAKAALHEVKALAEACAGVEDTSTDEGGTQS